MKTKSMLEIFLMNLEKKLEKQKRREKLEKIINKYKKGYE